MKPEVYYRKDGIFVHPRLRNDYIVKVPTRKNRMNKSGSAGLKMSEKYDLENNKKGILYIDVTAKAYVKIPKEILVNPVGKTCNGVKNSIFSYNVNVLVNDHNLEILPILKEDEIKESYELGLAGEIRKKFGL